MPASVLLTRVVHRALSHGQDQRCEPLMSRLLGYPQQGPNFSPTMPLLNRVSHHQDEPFIGFVAKVSNQTDVVRRIAQRNASRLGELLHGNRQSPVCIGNRLSAAALSEHVVKIP